MTFEEFQQHLLICRNPRKPAARLLILWVGAAEGPIATERWETARNTIGSAEIDLGLYRKLAERGEPRAVQLSCEIIREAPPWAQLAVLTMAIRVATAQGELSLEANLALRFLCNAFDERHDLDELFPLETGHPFPNLPEGDDWWSAEDEPKGEIASTHTMLMRIGQLRSELALSAGDWWSERMEEQFGGDAVQGPEYPRLAKRRGGRKLRSRILRTGIAALVLAGLGGLVVAKSSRIQSGIARKHDTVEAYRAFLDRFPKSKPAAKARLRLEQLLDRETWAQALQKDLPDGYRAYLLQHPEGEHRREAETALTRGLAGEIDLAYNQWNMPALARIKARHEGLTVVVERVDLAMQGLLDDPGWVVLSGALEDCRDYLQRHPETPKRAAIEKRIIDLELAEIKTRAPRPVMPLALVEEDKDADTSTIAIRNWSTGPVTILYGGPQSYRFVVEKGRAQSVQIKNGSYDVAVSGPQDQTHQFGRHEVRGGTYSLHFSGRPSPLDEDLARPSPDGR